MQQDNRFWFMNVDKFENGQIVRSDENICRKILAHLDEYLNNYIKLLVPPQESCCEHLERFLEEHNVAFQFPKVLRVGGDEDAEVGKQEEAGTPLVKSKMCRFAEINETERDREEHRDDTGKDEGIIYIPEPIGSPRSFFAMESPSLQTISEKPKVIFLPEPAIETLPQQKQTPVGTPSLPIRPRYTTQVSTISQKSNTVTLYSCWPPPIGIIMISLLEIILFFVNEKRPANSGRFSHGVIADWLMFDPYRRREVWRFMTYLFVHIGIQHLLVNLGVQIFLGVILEMVHQRWRVLTIYFAGIFAGSLGASVFNPRVKLAGASGGVYSLITAHIVTVILKWKDMQYPAPQLLIFLIVTITDLSSGLYSGYHSRSEDISYVAHGCGALAGFLVGFPILRRLSADMKIRWFQYVGLVVFGLLILAAIFWNIFATEFFPSQLV